MWLFYAVVRAFLAPPVVVFLASRYGWRTAFLLPSVLGLMWIIPWLAVYRRRAPEGPAEGPAAASPVRPIWTLRQAWGAALMRALGGPVNHFYLVLAAALPAAGARLQPGADWDHGWPAVPVRGTGQARRRMVLELPDEPRRYSRRRPDWSPESCK